MIRVIQTEGSRRIDGPVPCKEGKDTHTFLVTGEWDDPKEGQACRCGKATWTNRQQGDVG